jgi:hypothetical protein
MWYDLVAGSLGHPGVAGGAHAQQLHGLGVLDPEAQQLVGRRKRHPLLPLCAHNFNFIINFNFLK